MTGRRVYLPAALAALIVPLTAWAALGPRYGGTLAIGVLDLPSAFDPALTRGTGARLVLALVHDPLLRIGPDGSLRPGLAVRWDSSASGKEWSLDLPKETRFHDGAALTDADVVRSLRRFLRSSSDAARVFASVLDGGEAFRSRKTDDLPGLDVASDRRIVIRLADFDAHPLVPLTSPSAVIVSTKGSGCGPFVPLHPIRRQGVTLLSFRDHVRGRPFLDRIRIDLHSDTTALKRSFSGGAIALAMGEAGRSTLTGTLLLVLDASRPPFRTRSLRAAVSSTLDRDVLASRFLPGSSPSVGLLTPRLLSVGPRQTGVGVRPNARVNDSIVMAVEETVPPLASQRVTAHLTALGLRIRVEVVAASATRWPSAAARLLVFQPEIPDPCLALHELATISGPTENVLALLAESRVEIDADRRNALLRSAHDLLLRNDTLIPIAFVPVSFALGPKLEGVQTDRAGIPILEDVWIAP
jgi:ABC-type transport system substrate-binding protein